MEEPEQNNVSTSPDMGLTRHTSVFAPGPQGVGDTAAVFLVLCVLVSVVWVLWVGVPALFSRGVQKVDDIFAVKHDEYVAVQPVQNDVGRAGVNATTTNVRPSAMGTAPSQSTTSVATARAAAAFPVLRYYTIQTTPPPTAVAGSVIPTSFQVSASVKGDIVQLRWSSGTPGLRQAYLVNSATGRTYWLFGWNNEAYGNTLGTWNAELPPFLPTGTYAVRAYPDVDPFGGYVESDRASAIIITYEETGPIAFRLTPEEETVSPGDTGIALKIVINNPTITLYPTRALTVYLERRAENGQSAYSRELYRSGMYTDTSRELSQALFGWSVPLDMAPGQYELRATLNMSMLQQGDAFGPSDVPFEYSFIHPITVRATSRP